ncbi:MAG: Type 1 glutamine amidotransferase-like domain-containing protein [Anaerolineae bacterium]
MKGTLALAGSGEYLAGMEPVDRSLLARTPSAPRVVCLPTAAGTEGAARVAYWSNLGVAHFRKLGAQAEAVDIINREMAHDEALVDKIRAANFVYLSGGKPGYLFDTLHDSPAGDAIQGVLAAGGVVAGCSAGAMIWGEQFRSVRLTNAWKHGFGYVHHSAIFPHYDEIPEMMVRVARETMPHHLTILGIEGDTVLVKTEADYGVKGRGGVTVWNHHLKRRYRDNEVIPPWW